MDETGVKKQIEDIVTDTNLSADAKIDHLVRLREDVRAEMRAATESAMVNDNDVGAELKHLDQALEDLGHKPESPEDNGAATL
ncbi:hypothetical protein [Pararhizobium sp. IMCC21322]|uniref:hypothetical protein n=1 Tax=Pararhizobium sp. IMCC21322 TaxID=3067903 RepID=UPI002742170E|nr:hypothetical protein [Pararhizobium sp. IMCC21322]